MTRRRTEAHEATSSQPRDSLVAVIADQCRQYVWYFLRENANAANQFANNRPIDRLPLGYPQFCALIGAHQDFNLCSRFSSVRARLLLQKQDRVLVLEQRLKDIDVAEQRPLFLGSFREDGNPERARILEDLDQALADYDALVKRTTEAMRLPAASDRNISSLLNWVNGTGSISRSETSFLQRSDLCALGASNNQGLAGTKSAVEWVFIQVYSRLLKSPPSNISQDRRLFIFTEQIILVVSHSCITVLIVTLLMVPISLMRSTNNEALQIAYIMVNSIIFTVVLSGLMNARPGEVFGASATYATLLVAFLASTAQKVNNGGLQ